MVSLHFTKQLPCTIHLEKYTAEVVLKGLGNVVRILQQVVHM